ncbi:MAG: type II toxin-antitoxin system RelE/ParE family toxin [Treponema sp.]|jgi:plasmid stabilization system protein ParE|nr:type II toxin-antitoxin system RelE/ParE family toxin [Treponema sp.]
MAKNYHIKWAAPAREDINEIIDYISQTNINYAIKILDKIEDNVKQLDMLPERYRIVPELERYGYFLYREMIVDYWRIIYKIENNFVYIMLVIDSRRNLEDLIIKKIVLREGEI